MVVLLNKRAEIVGYYGDFSGVEEMPYLQRLQPAP